MSSLKAHINVRIHWDGFTMQQSCTMTIFHRGCNIFKNKKKYALVCLSGLNKCLKFCETKKKNSPKWSYYVTNITLWFQTEMLGLAATFTAILALVASQDIVPKPGVVGVTLLEGKPYWLVTLDLFYFSGLLFSIFGYKINLWKLWVQVTRCRVPIMNYFA